MALNQTMHLKSSDSFSTKDALWIGDWNCPEWLIGEVKRELFYMNARRGSSQDSNRSGSECRPDTVVVSKSPQRNEYSWTAQILQYTQCGQGRKALKVYEEMRRDGVAPSPYTFVALLKACSSLQDLESAKRIHAEVRRSGLEPDLYVSTMLVATYAKCRSLVDARGAFEKMPRRDVVSWNAIILGYAQMDKGEEALQLYSRMQQEGVVPDDRTYVSALKACSSIAELGERNERDGIAVRQRCLESVRATHVNALDGKFELECGSLEDSRHLFEKIYSGMQTGCVRPDTQTRVSAIAAQSTSTAFDDRNKGGGVLGNRRCLKIVRAIHEHAVNSKCDSDLFVGNMLIDVYAKCGSLEDARIVFEKLPHRTIISWNSMIQGYAQMHKGEDAMHLYTKMQQEGVIPDERTYVSVLKACSPRAETNGKDGMAVKEKCLKTVRAIHKDSAKAKFDLGVFLGTMLLDLYAKCGSLDDARQVFDMMPHRDVASWTAMILGYAQMDKGEEALELYTRMQHEGVVPDSRTYVGALRACIMLAASNSGFGSCGTPVNKRCLKTVRAIHSDVRKGKFDTDLFVGNILVDAYAKCGSLQDARCVFDKMPQHTAFSWNAIILGYAQMNKSEAALQLYMRMQASGTVPNDQTYVSALKACSTLAEFGGLAVKERCLKTVKSIHRDIVGGQFESDAFVGTMLLDVYAKCGSLEDSRCVFEKMAERTVVSWNAMISVYAHVGRGDEALELYTRMQIEGMVPDDRTYVIALKACSALAEKNAGGGIAEIKKCLEIVRSIHTTIVTQKVEPDVFVGTMFVDVYAKCGRLEDARLVFEKMPHRDVVAWTAMILGYTQMDKSEEALHLYSRMQQEGVAPDGRAYVGALNACGRVAELEKGKVIHAEVLEAGLTAVNFSVAESLIDMYARCGSMVHAQQVFDAMPTKGIEAWNGLITGYVHQGESQVVFDLFDRMKQEAVQPDDITLLGLLTVCSHVGLVERGQKYFTAMTIDYGVTPTIKHFTCMIDLLGRSGRLDKAMEVLEAMPFQPDSAVWACVLGACQKWGDIEIGKHAFECAVRLGRADAAAYNLMSNIYAAAQMHKEAEQIRTMRVKSRAWKRPGRSLCTDICGMARVFMVGDQRHPESESMYAKVTDLVLKMQKGDASHDLVLRDMHDDVKGDLCGHSEKLAIACALPFHVP